MVTISHFHTLPPAIFANYGKISYCGWVNMVTSSSKRKQSVWLLICHWARGGARHFYLGGALEGPVLQQGELSMVCVGLQCSGMTSREKFWGARQTFGGAVAPPGTPLAPTLHWAHFRTVFGYFWLKQTIWQPWTRPSLQTRDEHGSGRYPTGSGLKPILPDQDWIGQQFFFDWRITTGSDWENLLF